MATMTLTAKNYADLKVIETFARQYGSVSVAVDDSVNALRKHPYAGCMKGTFGEMNDDFNEPLDDFKDYM